MKRTFLLLIITVSVGCRLLAQSATFSNLRLEHNVPDKDGRKMLQFHYEMSVSGCLGHIVKVYMYVEMPKGTYHKFSDGNNMVTVSNALKCQWSQTKTTGDWWVAIYNDRLNPLSGKNTYYTRLWAKDENTGKWIGHSDYLTFYNTGTANNYSNGYANRQNSVAYLDVLRQYEGRSRVPDLGPYVRSERDEHSTQVIYRFYNEKGWQKYVAIGKCLYCHGTGKCSGFHFGFCSLCGNSGRCRYCGGNGTSLTIAAYGPTGYYSEDGVFHSSNSGGGSNVSVPNSGGGYSGGSSNNRSSSSSVYTKCNSCNGTGVCQHCHGKCGEWTNIGTYTGTNTKKWSNCVSCNGSGKCSICYGRGKL